MGHCQLLHTAGPALNHCRLHPHLSCVWFSIAVWVHPCSSQTPARKRLACHRSPAKFLGSVVPPSSSFALDCTIDVPAWQLVQCKPLPLTCLAIKELPAISQQCLILLCIFPAQAYEAKETSLTCVRTLWQAVTCDFQTITHTLVSSALPDEGQWSSEADSAQHQKEGIADNGHVAKVECDLQWQKYLLEMIQMHSHGLRLMQEPRKYSHHQYCAFADWKVAMNGHVGVDIYDWPAWSLTCRFCRSSSRMCTCMMKHQEKRLPSAVASKCVQNKICQFLTRG